MTDIVIFEGSETPLKLETAPPQSDAMLDAAAVAIEDLRTQTQLGLCSSEDIAGVALEAAGMAKMVAREARLLEAVGSADAETAISYIEDKFRGRDPQTAQMEARIKELEAALGEAAQIVTQAVNNHPGSPAGQQQWHCYDCAVHWQVDQALAAEKALGGAGGE